MRNHDEDETGTHARTPEQEAEAEVYLDQPESTDDVPWSPPDRQPVHPEYAESGNLDETIEERIAQEEPEADSAYGAPQTPAQERAEEPASVGGDDPDAIPAEQDVLGGPAEMGATHPKDYGAEPAEEAALQIRDGEE
ncbi:adenosine deaminase [Ruania suaedae]|uniref:adenosine deaminase n=1 Tax=Ruania suaedae TaxID=2897774 RepID=UPI001E49E8DD|nr:adenosine deaminase [Ruania suaedae]UFU01802.1 adenosine deaminase [Ruania suaedae]